MGWGRPAPAVPHGKKNLVFLVDLKAKVPDAKKK